MDGASRFRVRLMRMSCVKKLPAQTGAKLRKEEAMSRVRVLIGTRKGAFVLTSDATRERWDISGPLFAGWEIYHLKGSPADPNRLYASQSSGWFGQQIQRSDDGGQTWEPVGNTFVYDGVPGTHQWYDGTPHPWEFKRVWHVEPSLADPDMVYAGVEDAALFRSIDAGQTWQELPELRGVKGHLWQPGAGGMCLHTIVLDPSHPERIFVAISAAGVFRTDDAGQTWRPMNRGLKSPYELPDPHAEVGHCVHRIAMHRSRPGVLFMQKHWDVMRSDDAGESWQEISGNLPTDFGFPIVVHAHEPDTIYVVPIKSDSEHYPPGGKLRVYRSRTGGHEWEALTTGLPQRDCYVNVLRDAMAVDALDPCGVYFGTTGGQVYVSADSGDSWAPIVRDLPAVVSVEVETLP
jgi:BNR/Asp-box repeat